MILGGRCNKECLHTAPSASKGGRKSRSANSKTRQTDVEHLRADVDVHRINRSTTFQLKGKRETMRGNNKRKKILLREKGRERV